MNQTLTDSQVSKKVIRISSKKKERMASGSANKTEMSELSYNKENQCGNRQRRLTLDLEGLVGKRQGDTPKEYQREDEELYSASNISGRLFEDSQMGRYTETHFCKQGSFADRFNAADTSHYSHSRIDEKSQSLEETLRKLNIQQDALKHKQDKAKVLSMFDQCEASDHRPFYMQTSRHQSQGERGKDRNLRLFFLVEKYKDQSRRIWKGGRILRRWILQVPFTKIIG